VKARCRMAPGLRVSTAQSPRTVPLIPVLRRFKNAITSPTSSFDGYGPAGICCRIAKRSTSTRVPCERPHFCRRVAGSEYDREEIQWIGYLLKGTDQRGSNQLLRHMLLDLQPDIPKTYTIGAPHPTLRQRFGKALSYPTPA